jgi:hypothetical protein
MSVLCVSWYRFGYITIFGFIAQNIDDIEDCLELCTAKRNKVKMITADQKMAFKYGDLFGVVAV